MLTLFGKQETKVKHPMAQRSRGRPAVTTHDQIRDAALKLFLDRGYAATSLAAIAGVAGISRTTLFAYFRSKRDLIWEDHDRRAADVNEAMVSGPSRPLVDLIVRGLLVSAGYGVEDHATLARRMQVVAQDDELRAYAALTVQEMTNRVAQTAASRVPEADPRLVDLVTRALAAAASRCTEEWAAKPDPTTPLDTYAAAGIKPLVEALKPLLP